MEEISEIVQVPMEDEQNIFGQFDSHIKKLERQLQVSIADRNGEVRISGSKAHVNKAKAIIRELTEFSMRGNIIQEQNVDYAIAMSMEENDDVLLEIDKDCICHTVSGKPVKAKTLGQKQYVDAIRDNMIVFGLGPAGTGKTYLAMAMAITAFKDQEVERIILTRPAIEAGEKLGFLPGDLQSKVDPYLRPLYDALHQIMGAETFMKNMEKGLIEVAPLAYMRGRTLDNAYIILDEAQNTTPAQMKMFLTRIGFGSKVMITGDASQKDLAPGVASGLDVALKVLHNIEGIAFCKMTSRDVVRHPLVQKIVKAYEDYESNPRNRLVDYSVNKGSERNKRRGKGTGYGKKQ
ncbi:PhoH family protein [Parablautia muri]|uniref:PhoH-like protein n=1 Tax=Parablautia muri TaxID=2320879 RepID=A0A9X5GQE5_9FIRM|nr:PhoH family protein [Parablautia muri]NBJ92138.1 PhoH family protein [Parablautia muri]